MKSSVFFSLVLALLLPGFVSATTISGAPLLPSQLPALASSHKLCAENAGYTSQHSKADGTAYAWSTRYDGNSGSGVVYTSVDGAPTVLTPVTLGMVCGLNAAYLSNDLYLTRLYMTYLDFYRAGRCPSDYSIPVATRPVDCPF